MDEARIREMWNEIEQEKVRNEQEEVRYDQWLKERDIKKLEIERAWRPNYGLNKSPNVLKAQKAAQEEAEREAAQQPGTSATPSPLLTSLLKSSQANQASAQSPNTARSAAPTITTLLTGSSSSSSNSPLITQSSTAQNNLINASVSVLSAQSAVINHSASPSVQIPASQSAPTLITLLDKKSVASTSLDSPNEKQQLLMSISVPEGTGGKDGSDDKDEEEEILADFTDLIRDKFNDEDLEDINSIIMNPEILEDEMAEDKPLRDVDDSSQNDSTNDYDKLKIKKLIEDFSCVPDVEAGVLDAATDPGAGTSASADDTDTTHVPMDTETSCTVSVDLIEPAESNDSKEDSSAVEEKVIQISDESSTGNEDKKDQMSDKIETGEGDESQSVKSSVDEAKDTSGEDTKETRAFQSVKSGGESSDKNSKASATVYNVEDSDEDPFEDAKENHDDSAKTEKESESDAKKSSSDSKSKATDADEVAGSVDSDDEVLEVKVSRSTGRKKNLDSLKSDTPSSSTRSRDHSENDDNREAAPIRTRSRNSSVVAVNEPKAGLTKEQDHSFWKGRWEDCSKELHKHKDYTSVIDNKAMHDDSYKSIVLRPMNMKTIHKNIENSVSTMPGDIKRDFALMCSNIMMMNKRGSKFNETVYNFLRDGLETIDQHMDVDEVYISYRKQIRKKH